MHTIFERLVEELRAWHLFDDSKDYSLIWELPGTSWPGNGKTSLHRRDLQSTRPRPSAAR
jgi:hypothetical protein